MSDTAKNIMDLIFVVLFIGTIAPVVHLWIHKNLKGVDAEKRLEIGKALRGRLRLLDAVCGITLTAGLVWTGLSTLEIYPLGERINIPMIASCVIFHLIWWPLAMPIFTNLNQMLEEKGILVPMQAKDSVRKAELKPRLLGDYLPGFVLPVTAGLAVAGPLGIFLWALTHPIQETRLLITVVSLASTGFLDLVLLTFCTRFTLAAPVIVAQRYGPEKAEEVRRSRVRWIFAICTGMALMFFGMAVAVIEVDRGTVNERTLGLVGGIVGSVFGLGGAAIGISASFRENRLRRQSPDAEEALTDGRRTK